MISQSSPALSKAHNAVRYASVFWCLSAAEFQQNPENLGGVASSHSVTDSQQRGGSRGV